MSKFHEIQLGSLVTNLGASGPSRILGFYLHVETRLVYRDITVTVGHSNCVSAHSDFLHESTIIEFSCFRLKCLSHWAVYVLSDLPDSPWNVLLFRTRLLDVLEHNHDHHFHRVNLSLRLSLKHQDHDHTTPITHLLENSLDRRFFLHFVWHVSYLFTWFVVTISLGGLTLSQLSLLVVPHGQRLSFTSRIKRNWPARCLEVYFVLWKLILNCVKFWVKWLDLNQNGGWMAIHMCLATWVYTFHSSWESSKCNWCHLKFILDRSTTREYWCIIQNKRIKRSLINLQYYIYIYP